MKAQDKAKDLYVSFLERLPEELSDTERKKEAKWMAAYTVDQIIEGLNEQRTYTGGKFHAEQFYDEVKREIIKIQ